MLGCYVYVLLCQDGSGPVYIKIGISERPDKRLRALSHGCAISPRLFATVDVKNRLAARKLEEALHGEFVQERTVGEWFIFRAEAAGDFRRRCTAVLSRFDHDPTRPLRWSAVAVHALLRHDKRRSVGWLQHNRQAITGRARRDAMRHGLTRKL